MPEQNAGHELLPPASEPDKVGRRVFEILEEAVKDKASLGLHEKWVQNYRLGRNRPWKSVAPAGVPLASANFLHAHRQRTVNTLTDNHPTFNVSRVGEAENEETYRTMERLARFWWNEQEQQAVFERSVINGETYGAAIEKMVFDPDMEFGLGEVRTVVVDPFHFAVYPVKCLDVQSAEAVLHFRPMSLREAARRWPEAAGRIQSDVSLLAELHDSRREAARGEPGGRGVLARFGSVVKALMNVAGEARLPEDEVLVCECWARDYSMTPDGPMYPGGVRCATVCNGGRLVLDDRGNPSINPALPFEEAAKTYLFDKFPFTLVNSITDTAGIWGASDFEQLATLQREINKCLSQLTYHKDRCARPKIINPRDSGVHNQAFNNRLGIINPSSMASAQGIRYLDFSNNTKDIEAVLAIYKELFHQVAGSQDLEQAREQGSPVIAYKAIAMLMEQAATMMRGKIRNYSRLVRERGRMFLSHAQNWYSEKRWISFSEDGRDGSEAVIGARLRVPARLTVVSGSTMPSSKVQRREEALALFELGAIDRRELLEKLDWPGWAELAARMEDGVK
jgi:hypothetical protein